jgi:hypothetical protein
MSLKIITGPKVHMSFWYHFIFYTPRNEVVGGYTGFTMSIRLSVEKFYVVRQLELCFLESFKILSAVYWWREEDPFHFWRFSLLPFQSYWTWYDGKWDFYPMSYDNMSSVSQNVLKFYQQLTGEERATKNERDPPLFTGKLLIKFQNILRNTTQVIIRHRVKILFSVISSPITLERQKWKSSKMKGILLSSPVNSW